MYPIVRQVVEKEGRMFAIEEWTEQLNTYVNVTELLCEEYRSSYSHDDSATSPTRIADVAINKLIKKYPNAYSTR